MANYSLVANSVFQPFSYQELAAPLDRQEAYHEKLAEEYDKLSSQADILEVMGANDRDKKSGAYSKYKAYSDFLRSEADHLYQHGLDIDSRERLTDLRRRFNTDIIPIHNAWKKRETEAATQQQALLQNPHLMFTRDADKTSLDDYLTNPMGGYGVVNGATITAQMSQMASTLAKKIRAGEKVDIDPYTYNYIQKYGLTEDLIRDWKNNPSLSKMFEQVMKANGVTPEALANSMNAQSIIDRSTNYAEMGMWSAIGEDKSQVLENFGTRENLRHAHAMAQAAAANPTPPGDMSLRGSSLQFNFGDEAGAGTSLRNAFANTTADFVADWLKNHPNVKLKNKNSIEEAANYYRKIGDKGLKGEMSGDNVLTYIKQHDPKALNYLEQKLIQTANGDKKLVDMWVTYDSSKKSTATRRPTNIEYRDALIQSHDTQNSVWLSKSGNSATGMSVRTTGSNNWDDFDKAAHPGYFVNIAENHYNPTQEKNFLDRTFARNGFKGSKLNVYNIKSINANGDWEYGGRVNKSDMPVDKDGNVITSQVHMAHTFNSNGDIALYWDSGNGTQWGLLRAADIDSNLKGIWDRGYYPQIKAVDKKVRNGSITPAEAELEKQNIYNSYLNGFADNYLGEVSVEDQHTKVF